jgi:peptidoglycan/xylan/chitin deacetylase (PgdA/CDA1 family)
MNSPFLTTSWDDGHPLDFRIADLLSKYGLTGTFYIPRRCQTPTMSADQVRELSRYFQIGAHTMDHVFLDSCGEQTAFDQIAQSKGWVEEVTGKPCPMFCPPGGKFNPRRLAQIEAAGFKAIRTVEMMSVARPAFHNGLLIMPTTLQAHPHSPTVYLRNVLKRKGRNLWLYLTHGRNPDWLKLAERLLATTIARGGVFHLWGHSWEIEEHKQWSQLEDVLKMMSEHRHIAPCVTNWQVACDSGVSTPIAA